MTAFDARNPQTTLHRAPEKAEQAPVQLRNVVRQFGQQRVIDGLDLDIAPGEFVALLGASGSGKTTLLRTLAGLDSIDSGELRVPVARAAVFQEPRLMPWKSAWKNVVLGLHIDNAKARAEAALGEVGLSHRVNAFPATLSGGEAQRVALARGLVREPKLLLLDEPFAALDALTRIRMHQLIIDLWRKHTPAVLLVTHDVDEAILLADRVIVLANGRIADEIRIELPRQRDSGQAGFQAIRGRLLGLLGVKGHEQDAEPDDVAHNPTLSDLRRVANAR
ncbi:ABC transporter ATP-binding protein [Pseudomonas viridiflava]|uniref:ABC transporter ATP-binding protein n=1 Tax=Pseudomonas viridiflava TaxID=33069 RepID=UPI001F07D366|nr:ABC transporter ATP-binding protein [Pseudomonas viridiflava]